MAIPSDLILTGGVYQVDGFDTFVENSATQTGSVFGRVGGSDTTFGFTDDPGPPGSVTTLPTMHGGGVVGAGDGYGGSATASADLTAPGSLFYFCPCTLGSGFNGDTDLGDGGQTPALSIMNSSVVLGYHIFVSLTYSHSADADGDEAFANSDLELLIDDTEVFEAEIWSDTLFGDELNDVLTGGFGANVSDSGVFQTSFVIAPGQTRTLGLDHTWAGLALDVDGSAASSLSASYFLSLDDIIATPEPGTFGLLGAALAVLAFVRFRRRV